MTTYEFVNVWPSNLTSMRLAYRDSNVLKCNIQFLYDRFFTSFHKVDNGERPVSTPENLINSKDIPIEKFERSGEGSHPENFGTFYNIDSRRVIQDKFTQPSNYQPK